MKWIIIISSLISFSYIIKQLYEIGHADKLIIKMQRKKHTASTIIITICITIVCIILIEQIIDYLKGNQIDVLNVYTGIYRICVQKQSIGIGQTGVSLEVGRNLTSFYK